MKTHDLIQGSAEWHAYRARHFNASDAPAMMGVSPYKTRSQLLHEQHSGIGQEFDEATQRRFDDGHRFEALARPLAEAIIGEDLYPVTGSEARYSASFDGLTMGEDVGFEHKSLNDELRAVMTPECTGADLPMHYQIQMEQQCMVSGASRILFMASKWQGEELIEERHCWYYPNLDLRAKIIAGWEQFAADLETYVPPVESVEAVGRAPEMLPALHIEVTGMVTASNLGSFREYAAKVFGAINRDLKTDQDFADAEKTVKWCSDVEERLEAAKQHALSQTASIDDLFRTIDGISAEARAVRLELDRLVKARKESLRDEIRQEVIAGLRAHYEGINAGLSMGVALSVPASFGSDVAAAMKGKKTLSSLRDAASTTLAAAKIEANTVAERVRKNITILQRYNEHAFLLPDAAQLATSKESETLELIVKSRIAEHKVAEEKRLAAAAEAKVAVEVPSPAPAQNPPATRPAPETQPSLRLGQIGERLGFAVTATLLSELGFAAAGKERAAVLYHEHQFDGICAALIARISKVRAAHQMKEAA